MSELELPCVRERTNGKPLDITAQVCLSYTCDGRKVTVPTFVQQEREQSVCNIFSGITVRRANGKPLHAAVECNTQ